MRSDETLLIAPLPADQWPKHKKLRLEALQNAPQAFGASYANAIDKADEFWEMRTAHPSITDVPLMLFAQRGDEAVGMIGAYIHSPGEVQIIAMYVTESERGSGIGRRLMEAILERISEETEIQRVGLTVNTDQAAALALYTSLGFEIESTTCEAMGDGIEHEQHHMVRRPA